MKSALWAQTFRRKEKASNRKTTPADRQIAHPPGFLSLYGVAPR